MLCYDCSKAGKNREAVGLCHNCSAGLCSDHACVTTLPVTATYPIYKTAVLPQRARRLLCATCLQALRQARIVDLCAETSKECCPAVIAAREKATQS
jgi:hypothetical protein